MIKEKIYNLIASQFSLDLSELNDSIGPGDLPAWDSLGQMQLIVQFEKEFGINLSVDDVMSMNNIGDICQILEKATSRSSSSHTPQVDSIDQQEIASITSPEENRVSLDTGQTLPSSTRPIPTTVSHILPSARLAFGSGSLDHLPKHVGQNVLLVLGSTEYSEVLKQRVVNLLSAKTVQVVFKPNGEPTLQGIQNLTAQLTNRGIDTIVAIGGGSTIDIAKLVWLTLETEQEIQDFITPFSCPVLNKIKFIAVPTTFGSGSESSSSAVFRKDQENKKCIIVSHSLLPQYVILDASLGETAPLAVLLQSGFDALTHSIEGFVSTIDNPFIDFQAEQSIRILIPALKSLLESKESTKDTLNNLAFGSYLAGIVQNHCSVGLTHSISHALAGYGIPHGASNTIFLHPVMNFNSETTNRYQSLAIKLGYADQVEFLKEIDKLVKLGGISIDGRIKQNVLSNISSIIPSVKADLTFKTNPRSPSDKDIHSIIASALQ